MPREEFERRLDELIGQIKGSATALDQERIYVPGEKEYARAAMHARKGIPLARNVRETLVRIGEECGAPPLLTLPAAAGTTKG